MFNTPILFLIFNRPESTAIVFDQIKRQKPKKLYIAADGPRANRINEEAQCEITRNAVLEKIDWDCEVNTLFRTENLGCGKAVSQAITWFFEKEEQGIILEDDCVPSESFFSFCAALLEKYKDDSNVMHITGTNLNDKKRFNNHSYHFSGYAGIWGWATWRRAWEKYDFELADTHFYKRLIRKKFKDPFERKFWNTVLNTLKNVDTWDYQWMFSIWKAGGLCINTNYNFISNIGFDENATHTTYSSRYSNLPVTDIDNELIHPDKRLTDKKAEEEFLATYHDLKRLGYGNYFLMRANNLKHKIKLLITPGSK
jgi:hypothetical protein